jgi:hypothetical protein
LDIGFDVFGDRGAIKFSWTRPSELAFYDATARPQSAVTPASRWATPTSGLRHTCRSPASA